LEIANGSLPHKDNKILAMYKIGTEGLGTLCKPSAWSDDFKNFLSCCLNFDPSKRLAAADLLEHQFIKKADTRKSMQKVLQTIFITNMLTQSGLGF